MADRQNGKGPIDDLTQILARSNLQNYAPYTEAMQGSNRQHRSFVLGSSVKPRRLINQMGPWLHNNGQGMWQWQLNKAEQTVCIGWLLYLAPEYDRTELRLLLRRVTGADVALRFQTIREKQTTPADKSAWIWTKALHVEADSRDAALTYKQIASIYSATAQSFPMGLKMQLVPTNHFQTSRPTQARSTRLLKLQRRFLSIPTTRIFRASPISIVNKHLRYQQELNAPGVECSMEPYTPNQAKPPNFSGSKSIAKCQGIYSPISIQAAYDGKGDNSSAPTPTPQYPA